MSLIYNRSGIVVLLTSILIGLPVFLLAGRISPGVLAVAASWVGLSFWWRNRPREDGWKPPFPALFFIPMPILAVPLAVLGVLLFFEGGDVARSSDPRAARLADDVTALKASKFGGDAAVSRYLHDSLLASASENAGVDAFHFFTRIQDDSALVLVTAPNLKRLKEPSRVELLSVIEAILARHPRTSGKRAFIGVRGNVAFGALRVPPDLVKTGSVVDPSPLYAFYEAPKAAVKGPTIAPPSLEKTLQSGTVKEKSPASADPVAAALEGLASNDRARKLDALNALARTPPDAAHRDEVVRALLATLDQGEPTIVNALVKPLVAWGTPEALVPELTSRLESDNVTIRRRLIRLLGGIKDPRASEALAARLANPTDAFTAESALKQQGSIAEPAAAALLKSPDAKIRKAACEILGDIGGEDSLALLKGLSDPDSRTQIAARSAIGKIEFRSRGSSGTSKP